MTRQQKKVILEQMQPILAAAHLYLIDSQGLTANQTHKLRGMLHEKDITCRMLPNALLKILFKQNAQEDLLPILKNTSMVLITEENPNVPAKVLKEFYKLNPKKKPQLKGAFVYGELFVGQKQLEALTKLKSKEELLGEIIGLLQSPTQNILAALQSGNQKIAGILKALEQR